MAHSPILHEVGTRPKLDGHSKPTHAKQLIFLLAVVLLGGLAARSWWAGKDAWRAMERGLDAARSRLSKLATELPVLRGAAQAGDARETYETAWTELATIERKANGYRIGSAGHTATRQLMIER